MAQSDDLDLYAVLGVAEDASDTDIRAAYKREALKWHPDKVKGDADPAEAEARFKAINHAFSTLSDPDRRADYDAGGVGDADVRRHEEMARAFWEEIMREDARVREAPRGLLARGSLRGRARAAEVIERAAERVVEVAFLGEEGAGRWQEKPHQATRPRREANTLNL